MVRHVVVSLYVLHDVDADVADVVDVDDFVVDVVVDVDADVDVDVDADVDGRCSYMLLFLSCFFVLVWSSVAMNSHWCQRLNISAMLDCCRMLVCCCCWFYDDGSC